MRIDDQAPDTVAGRRMDENLRIGAVFGAQRLQQALHRVVHGELAELVHHLDRLGLLPEQEHPVGVVERGLGCGVAVVVVHALGGGHEGALVLARPAVARFDKFGSGAAREQVPGLVDDHDLLAVPREVHLAGDAVHHDQQHHGLEILLGLQFLQFQDDEVGAEVDGGVGLEILAVGAVAGIRMQHRCQVLEAPVVVATFVVEPAGGKQVVHVGHPHGAALGLPDLLDRRAEGGILETIQRLAWRHHLRKQRLQQFHVLVDVGYEGEGVE